MNELVRFDDATLPQIAAANPASASWVSANAGSGKTKVLTDRVARLLLTGTPPEHILCLTYTIVAAANMQVKLFERLGEWSMLPDEELKERLLNLGESEESLNSQKLENARTLFASALETPGGLKIQTLHSFSANLLKRFPLEAGISPRFKQIDDQEARILQDQILDEMATEAPEIYQRMAGDVASGSLRDFVNKITTHRDKFLPPAKPETIMRQFNIEVFQDLEELAKSLFLPEDIANLTKMKNALAEETSKASVSAFADLDVILRGKQSLKSLDSLIKHFLTSGASKTPFSTNKTGLPRKVVLNQLGSDFEMWLQDYRERVSNVRLAVINQKAAQLTCALHEFVNDFQSRYEQRKQERALLDFNDLILKSLELLKNKECAQWVLFRLDGGIEHVLIDEAQDVSPTQWEIIKEISREFTAGKGIHKGKRTIFAVGDEKQSIFGFQGAAPEKFDMMKHHFSQNYFDAEQKFVEETLQFSFRSSEAILNLVDAVFKDCEVPGFSSGMTHQAFKKDLPGRVDLWPFIKAPKKTQSSGSIGEEGLSTPELETHIKLAKAIAYRIKTMLENGELLPTDNGARPVEPGDILILLRRRSDLFHAIIRELRANGLPIAGTDRLKVIEELATRDLKGLLSFLAYNEDDLSLAAVLRSPLFALTEEELFEIAHNRGKKSLWESLQQNRKKFAATVEKIKDLITYSSTSTPYEILERILTWHKGRELLVARLGSEIDEAIDAYLQQALDYEEQESATLTEFMNWIDEDVEVKRQLDQGSDEIRVMSIHGAKGLESPIVILPDTEVRNAPPSDTFEALDANSMPLYMVNKDVSPEIIQQVREAKKQRELEEQFRLLYVALTRAESWLIACGEGKINDDCWYSHIRNGIDDCGGQEHCFISETGIEENSENGLRLSFKEWPQDASHGDKIEEEPIQLPDWVERQPKRPKIKEKTLSPSKLGGYDENQTDSSQSDDSARDSAAEFGTRVHLLLEHLPKVHGEKRLEAAKSMLKIEYPDLEEDLIEESVDAAIRVMENPDLGFLFDGRSIPEVGITSCSKTLGNKQLYGYIDCLLVEESKVLAVDYKSNLTVPDKPEDIPESILRQMGAYEEALGGIYPSRSIETAILWTREAKLMPVPSKLSQEALQRAAVCILDD